MTELVNIREHELKGGARLLAEHFFHKSAVIP